MSPQQRLGLAIGDSHSPTSITAVPVTVGIHEDSKTQSVAFDLVILSLKKRASRESTRMIRDDSSPNMQVPVVLGCGVADVHGYSVSKVAFIYRW